VHPAKAEVRLRDATGIKSLLISAIKNAVQQPLTITTAQSSAATPYYAPIYPSAAQNFAPMLAELPTQYRTHQAVESLPVVENISQQTWQPLVQLFDTYIVALSDQGLVLVDQHAAHERIVYEQLKNTLAAQQTIPAQQLLLPEIVTLDVLAYEALLAVAEPLSALGLVIESFGGNAVAVQATPALLGANIDIHRLVHDLAELAQQDSAENFLEKRLFEVAAKMACYGSVRAGRRLNMPEMQSLLAQMAETNASGQCNHGRPTVRLLGENDFARLFERS
jgi:DNA mismatch repair protein MutL